MFTLRNEGGILIARLSTAQYIALTDGDSGSWIQTGSRNSKAKQVFLFNADFEFAVGGECFIKIYEGYFVTREVK